MKWSIIPPTVVVSSNRDIIECTVVSPLYPVVRGQRPRPLGLVEEQRFFQHFSSYKGMRVSGTKRTLYSWCMQSAHRVFEKFVGKQWNDSYQVLHFIWLLHFIAYPQSFQTLSERDQNLMSLQGNESNHYLKTQLQMEGIGISQVDTTSKFQWLPTTCSRRSAPRRQWQPG